MSWVDFLLWPELPESLNATFYCKEKDCLVFFWPFSLLLLETRTCLHRHSVSLASRLDQEMRRRLILHETRFTRLRFFTFHFIDVDTLYLFLNWFSMRVSDDQKYVCGHRLQCIHLYKYKKIQGSRFQRNYIIARDQKSDLHGTSFQSSPKINRMLITRHLHTMNVYNTPPSQFC